MAAEKRASDIPVDERPADDGYTAKNVSLDEMQKVRVRFVRRTLRNVILDRMSFTGAVSSLAACGKL